MKPQERSYQPPRHAEHPTKSPRLILIFLEQNLEKSLRFLWRIWSICWRRSSLDLAWAESILRRCLETITRQGNAYVKSINHPLIGVRHEIGPHFPVYWGLCGRGDGDSVGITGRGPGEVGIAERDCSGGVWTQVSDHVHQVYEPVPEHRVVLEEWLSAGASLHGGESGGDSAGFGEAQAEGLAALAARLSAYFTRQQSWNISKKIRLVEVFLARCRLRQLWNVST